MAILALLIASFVLTCGDAAFLRRAEGRRLGSLAEIITPIAGEPSCEDLRVMWRFSRRQNRVAEITNEIPTYRDPFAYNVWDELPRPKDMIGTLRSGGRSWNRPVYGRIVQNAPKNHPRIGNMNAVQAYEEVLRYLGSTNLGAEPRHKAPGSAFRLTGGHPRPSPLSQMGSFQHLKQLIWAERAKELQEQRMQEEETARSTALKDVKVPTHYNRVYGKQLFEDRFPNDGEIRYFDDGYAGPNRYFPGPAMRKSYRFNPASTQYTPANEELNSGKKFKVISCRNWTHPPAQKLSEIIRHTDTSMADKMTNYQWFEPLKSV